jgi:lipopolysaccharide transport system permease protein
MARTRSTSSTAAGGPTLVISAGGPGLGIPGAELWAYRELLYFLAWKELKVRYKQTALGAG